MAVVYIGQCSKRAAEGVTVNGVHMAASASYTRPTAHRANVEQWQREHAAQCDGKHTIAEYGSTER